MKKGYELYLNILKDIKYRTSVIDQLFADASGTNLELTVLESACLQLRKILEQIAFGSLVSNVELYSQEYKKFQEFWNAEYLLKDMAKVNPKYFPIPISQDKSAVPGVKSQFNLKHDDIYLNPKEFIKVYKKCGAILHASNPFGSKVSNEFYKKSIPIWRNKIINLLNSHQVHFVGDKNLYLFQMGAKDESPSLQAFEPVQ
ncbi:hypothetical protein HII17_03395 [Thalassotalea sp. M1531]|uniref:Uncharacterized protein n=2 Tax=Thalassotalea algicola TaxID=2716224 RepID=A0A7Y0LAM2_9GAMM|nr:hypothetical protein [Thalassotalea algicola]